MAPEGGSNRSPRKRNLLATLVALPALLLSIVALGLSWRAYSVANDAAGRPAAATAVPSGAATQSPAEPASEPAPATEAPAQTTGGPTGAVPSLNAQTQYREKYVEQTLRIPGTCNNPVFVDLDEPRVQVNEAIAELRYFDPCGTDPAYFTLASGAQGSAVESESTTPVDCADQIRRSPLFGGGEEPVRAGTYYCFMTSLNNAEASGETWKMIVLSVAAVAQDGTVALRASAWDIPD